jgi:iron-sulfur cluster assembly protein
MHMLTLTPDAQLAIRTLVEADPAGQAGIRIAATESVNGEAPQLGLEVTPTPEAGDAVIDDDGARVFLDETAVTLLDQETLDVAVHQESRQIDFYLA